MDNIRQQCDTLRHEIKVKSDLLISMEHNCNHKYLDSKLGPTCELCGYIIHTSWFCPSSPTGLCIYVHNEDYDTWTGECHYCGLPEERK